MSIFEIFGSGDKASPTPARPDVKDVPAEPLRWHAGPNSDANLVRDDADAVEGRIAPLDGRACYLTLGPTPAKYDRIDEGVGVPVGTDLLVRIEYEVSGKATPALLVMEYDATGARINTLRIRKKGPHHYRPTHRDVARVVVALRVAGSGTTRIDKLGWQPQTDIMERGLSRARHRAAMDVPASDGRLLVLDQTQTSAPFTLWPTGSVKLLAFDLSPGRYDIDIMHRDPLLAGYHDELEARVIFDTPFHEGLPLEILGFERIEDDILSGYVPPVSRGGGRFRHRLRFTVFEHQDWVVVELNLGLDRVVNVDHASLRLAPLDKNNAVAEDVFAERVDNYLSDVRSPERIQYVVYSQISPNVVDGSSIWLSSLLSMLTAKGRTILISQMNVESDIVLSNVPRRDRIEVLSPEKIRRHRAFTTEEGIHLLRRLDERLPNLRNVLVRGSAVAAKLFDTRRFDGRGFAYLTDFYEYGEEGIEFPDAKVATIRLAAAHAGALLTQNNQVAGALRTMAGRDFYSCLLPPAIPALDVDTMPAPKRRSKTIRIGYAGKINPRWGIVELLDWAERLREEGAKVELHIVSNKISESAGRLHVPGFRKEMLARFEELGVKLQSNLNREAAIGFMQTMDYVWCWRPAELEEHTLELSTKLVEMVAFKGRCICYPNAINRDLLGEDYPFYVRDFDDFERVLSTAPPRPVKAGERLLEEFSLEAIGERLTGGCLNPRRSVPDAPKILVAGNGLKFVEPYVSSLKARGYPVKIDLWEWGRALDHKATERLADWADTVFCECGLANAVWYSRHKRPGQRLIVRCHAQEVREKAERFGHAIDAGAVDLFVFVSERIRRRAIELFGWPEEKTVVIPNFLLEDEFAPVERAPDDIVHLGLVGMIPSSKRFDRAVDLLEALGKRGIEARLHVKGHRPEGQSFMFAPGRIGEMRHYFQQYKRIADSDLLDGKVEFDGWGNDVAEWYRKIDFILSPSDHESFHYALADGVLTGCHPIVWPWQDAERIYDPDWVVEDAEAAADRVEAIVREDEKTQDERRQRRRGLLVERYGHREIFERLDEALLGRSATTKKGD